MVTFNKNNTFSIIVTYFPKLSEFKKILTNHKKNFKKIIIINNSPEVSLKHLKNKDKVIIVNNKKNLGLAKALNIGIKKSIKRGAKMVCLFDQDTHIDDDHANKMLLNINAFKFKKETCLYNSLYFNKVTNKYGSLINFKFLRLVKSMPNKSKNYTFVEYAITSGSFIPINFFKKIGYMRNKLFIDFIDIDWGLRAKKRGYKIVIFHNVKLTQHLGSYKINFFGNSYPIHSPSRIYYYFRNSCILYKTKYVEFNWKLIDISRNIFRIIFYILIPSNRTNYLKNIFKGIFHGLKH